MIGFGWRRGGAVVAVLVAAGVAFLVWRGSGRNDATTGELTTETVKRQDITVSIEATGTVEPIDLVEVKSKASGQIVRMPVAVGSVVRRGDLLAQIDMVTVRNQYDQASAALRAAQAKADISKAQKERADGLFAQGVITAPELESATLDYANSQSSLVKARTDLDLARQARDDATVRAPVDGTVLEQPVAVGQVIASATSSVSGGTTLLKMADLSRIRLRALVAETDIGSVKPGMSATVTVEAFPQRPFTASVEKIEPQAVVQQSVTMFPVLISITNEDGLLLPGMNGEVSVLIAERDAVPSISLDAVRTLREVSAVAPALGLDADSVRAQVMRQVAEFRAARRESSSAGRATVAGLRRAGRDSSGSHRGFAGARGSRGASGSTGALAGGADAGRAAGSANGGRASAANRAQVAFVRTAQGLEPRALRLGLSNYDVAEVLGGVQEGDEVVLLSVAEIQARRQQEQSRIRERMGSGMPGVSRTTGGSSSSSGGRGTGSGGGR